MKMQSFALLLIACLALLFVLLTTKNPANHNSSPVYAQYLLNSSPSEMESTNILIAEAGRDRVIEINKNTGSIVWQAYGYAASCAYRLRSGNTLICDDIRVVEIDSAGNVVWSVTIPGVWGILDAVRIPNGNTLLSVVDYSSPSITGRIIEIDSNGIEVWSEENLHWPSQAVRLPPRVNPRDNSPKGSTLMAYGTILIHEKSQAGGIIWWNILPRWAGSLQRLPNLNTLVGGSRMLDELDYNGNLVWSVSEGLSRVGSVQRLSNGNTLVVDIDNDRVIEISPEGDIIWSRTGLDFPASAQLLNDYPPPTLFQTAVPWKDDLFANNSSNDDDIERWGCYMTSASIIINYWGQESDSFFTTDPGTFNYWLQNHDGYDAGNLVVHSSISEYARINNVPLTIDGYIPTQNDTLLNSYLLSGRPAIIGVDRRIDPDTNRPYPGHFVVATGRTTVNGNDTYEIFDPINGQTTLYEQWNNDYFSALLISTEPDSQASLRISAHSPIELLVTDPLNRKSGYDPVAGIFWDEIPDSEYFLSSIAADGGQGEVFPLSKVLLSQKPIEGEYNIEIFGVGNGNYEVDIFAANHYGTVSNESHLGIATDGSYEEVVLTYDPNKGMVYLPLIEK